MYSKQTIASVLCAERTVLKRLLPKLSKDDDVNWDRLIDAVGKELFNRKWKGKGESK